MSFTSRALKSSGEERDQALEHEDFGLGSAKHLEPSFIFGVTSSVRKGTYFIGDNTIVRPIGRVLLFDPIVQGHEATPNQPSREFIRVKSPFKVDVTAVSPDRKVLAVAIHGGSKSAISFYNTNTLIRLITVGCPLDERTQLTTIQTFLHIAFTEDGMHLVAVTSEPDGRLIYYKWRNGGVVATTRADGKWTGATSVITALAPHPTDSSKLVVGGQGIFRMMALYYNEWRQFGFKRAEYWPISGICWITPQLVLVGTSDGRLMVIEDALLKAEFKVSEELTEIRVLERDDTGRKQLVPFNTNDDDVEEESLSQKEVRGLTSFPLGFAFSFTAGEVCVFFKVNRRQWIKKNVISTGAPSLWQEQYSLVNHIKHIDVSFSQQRILCTSSAAEVYYTTLNSSTEDQTVVRSNFEKLHDGYHYGPVAAMSCCLYKPLFLTAGIYDRTCRIWNYETFRMVNSITFSENIVTAAFHPSGLYCIVCFEKKIQMYMILMEGMRSIATFNMKNCNLLSFTKEGNIFGCSNDSSIHIYGSTSFEEIWRFPTKRACTSLHFAKRDYLLFTSDMDGVCKYCLKTGHKLYKLDMDNSIACGVTSTQDGSSFVVVEGDGCMKVYEQRKDQAENDADEGYDMTAKINLKQSVLNCVTLSCEDTVLLVAGASSTIVSVSFPVLHQEPDVKIFKIHSSPLIKLDVAHVTATLISLGRDGVVAVWNLTNLKRKIGHLKHFREVDEVIVNAENWSNKRTIIRQQQKVMAGIDKEYHIKLKEIVADREDQEAKIQGRYQGVLDIIELNNKITLTKNIASLEKMTKRREELCHNFEQELANQRGSFETRLKNEQDDLERWHRNWHNVKFGFDELINSVRMAGQCVSKRLEYFSAMELTRRVNETYVLKDSILQIIEEQKNRELTMLKHAQIEVDELVENSERHEQTAVEIIQLKGQKQKLCEQVDSFESTYYNMQEFLKEIQKTVTTLDKRKSQRTAVEVKQKKILEKIEAIEESGQGILGDLDISKEFHIRHMVTEECVERLCQMNPLLEERKALKLKVQWLRQELSFSTRSLNRLRYVFSFMSLQSFLHNNALQRTIAVEKDRRKKLKYFKTNLKREIHRLMCTTDHIALKGRLIHLCAQYANPKIDYLDLLDKLSDGRELWNATEHLEATKLHFGRSVNRMKQARKDRSFESLLREEMELEEARKNDVDSGSSTSETEGVQSQIQVDPTNNVGKKGRRSTKEGSTLGVKKKDESNDGEENRSSSEVHNTSDSESSEEHLSDGEVLPEERALKKEKSFPKKQPIPVLRKIFRSSDIREKHYSELLDEKQTIAGRLVDVRKRLAFFRKTEKPKAKLQGRTLYRRSAYKIPMNAVIRALNKEVDRLATSPECRTIAEEVFSLKSTLDDEETPNIGHLCSLCKDYGAFTKYYEKKRPCKPSTSCGTETPQCKSNQART